MNLLEKATSEGVQGFLHCDDCWRLAELARGKDVLECGAYRGLSAYCMAQTAKSVQSVDTFASATDGQRQTDKLTTLDDYKKAVARFPNVLPPIVATSEEADKLPEMQGRFFDFVFVDAGHDYINVRADIVRWYPRVRMGGTIAFHDYAADGPYPDVKKAVDEAFGEPPEGTVEMGLRWITKREGLSTRVTIKSNGLEWTGNYAEPLAIYMDGMLVERGSDALY